MNSSTTVVAYAVYKLIWVSQIWTSKPKSTTGTVALSVELHSRMKTIHGFVIDIEPVIGQ